MNTQKPKVGLVGYGYWGPNLLRNLVSQGSCEVIAVVETQEAARAKVSRIYPQIPVYASMTEFLAQARPDAVVIATPPSTHREIAVRCLNAGCHVLVEKPLALSTSECDEILAVAKRNGRAVMVDHTFVYNPAVQMLASNVQSGSMGDLLYYDSVRANLGGYQTRANVLWDLAPHDLSILDLLTGGEVPTQVSAVGVKHYAAPVEDICYLHLQYERNFVAHLHLNWIAPIKLRRIMVGGSRRMAVYDENLPAEKLKFYDQGINVTLSPTQEDCKISYRLGDMLAPAVSPREPLDIMVAQFVKLITEAEAAPTDGEAGRRIVQILEAASQSMKESGRPVAVQTPAGLRLVRKAG